jgi:predicted kinase
MEDTTMKNNILYFLRAIPGTGKSTFIKENNFEAFTLSMDIIREMVSGLSFDFNDELHLSQHRNSEVYGIFKDLLVKRMKDGGPIILDNYHAGRSTYSKLVEIAINNGYESKIIDFPLLDIEEVVKRNQTRINYKRVSEDRAREMFYSFQAAILEEDVLPCLSTDQAVSEIKVSLNDLTVNLNNYNKVHHIGDLQGTFNPINDYFDEYEFQDDEFYIFLGDYIDRGVQNAKAIEFVLSLQDKDNVVFLKGNHEIHLHNHAFNLNVYSREFNEVTKPQLEKAQIKKKDLKRFVRNLKDFYAYEFNDKKVFCTHAGIGSVPEYPRMVSPMMYIKGQGGYEYDIDSHFNKSAPKGWYQMHGHRNKVSETFYDPERDTDKRSFSLESDVEHGGKLSVMQLSKEGFNLVKIKAELLKINGNKIVKHTYENTKENELEIISEMKKHSFIQEKSMKSRPYISSYNFTKEAFFNKEFDEISTKARGLFINNETNEVVARGYDKFFNVGEHDIPMADHEFLKDNMKGAINTYIKENGFLGILGYDSVKDELFFASKSTCDSDFAGYFEDIFNNTVTPENRERIKHDFKKNNLCAVFEVNDPVNDPHIVEYEKPHIVILDIFKRELVLNRLSNKVLHKFGEKYDISVKGNGPSFSDVSKFLMFNNKVANENPLNTKHKFEGFVAEDELGNMIKIKLPYYNYWKQMRGIVHRIKKQKLVINSNNDDLDKKIRLYEENDKIPEANKEIMIKKLNGKRMNFQADFIDNSLKRSFFIKEEQYDDAKKFMEFLFEKNTLDLKEDIVSLRNEFEKALDKKKRKISSKI